MKEIRKAEGDPGALNIFMPLVKVDAKERTVWGVVTAEVPDKENEVCDYTTTIPYYKALVDEMSKATDGVNIFPLREMHGLSAAGKGISIEFREGTKEVYMGFKVVDDAAWNKVEESVYTGFSQGGRYVKRWQDGEYIKYTAKPVEVSLVDVPCLTRAHFDYVKADGTVEKRAFKKTGEIPAVVEIPTVPTAVLTISDIDAALVAERAVVTIPSEEEKAALLAREIQSKVEKRTKYLADNNDRVKEEIKDTLTDTINNRAFGQLDKGMYAVSCFADIIEQLKYLWLSLEYEREMEGDESPATDDLKTIFSSLLNTFLVYTEEQVEELSAHAAAFEGGLAMATQSADLEKAARKSLASHFQKSARHHEGVAAIHEKIVKGHEGAAAHYEAQMGKATDPEKDHHKTKVAYHKSAATQHDQLHKRHLAHADHMNKMASAMAEDDATKCLKLAGIEEAEIEATLTQTTETAAVIVTPPPAQEDMGKLATAQAETNVLLKALIEKLSAAPVVAPPVVEAVAATTAVENAGIEAARKAAEMLVGASAARSFPIPRTGSMTKAGGIDQDAVDPQFRDLVSVEHVE